MFPLGVSLHRHANSVQEYYFKTPPFSLASESTIDSIGTLAIAGMYHNDYCSHGRPASTKMEQDNNVERFVSFFCVSGSRQLCHCR